MKYLQIDKGNCAGNRSLFDDIKKDLEKTGKYEIEENEVIFTIKEKEVKKKEVKKIAGKRTGKNNEGNRKK